jgi:hypothetical protein
MHFLKVLAWAKELATKLSGISTLGFQLSFLAYVRGTFYSDSRFSRYWWVPLIIMSTGLHPTGNCPTSRLITAPQVLHKRGNIVTNARNKAMATGLKNSPESPLAGSEFYFILSYVFLSHKIYFFITTVF